MAHGAPDYNLTTITGGGGVIAIPIGGVLIWPDVAIPSNFLDCDGSAVSRVTYASLFAIIGITYGSGDGSTTFNVPNFKGLVPVGYNASETEFDTMGEQGGSKTHTLLTTEIPAHLHGVKVGAAGGGNYVGGPAPSITATRSTENAGGGGAHNNLQPYIAQKFIICSGVP